MENITTEICNKNELETENVTRFETVDVNSKTSYLKRMYTYIFEFSKKLESQQIPQVEWYDLGRKDSKILNWCNDGFGMIVTTLTSRHYKKNYSNLLKTLKIKENIERGSASVKDLLNFLNKEKNRIKLI